MATKNDDIVTLSVLLHKDLVAWLDGLRQRSGATSNSGLIEAFLIEKRRQDELHQAAIKTADQNRTSTQASRTSASPSPPKTR